MREAVKDFIRDRLELIDNDDWVRFYDEASMHDAFQWLSSIGEMTEFFYSCGADIIAHLEHIPLGFMAASDRDYVILPDHIKSIGVGAFRAMKNLEKITIPAGCTKIGTDAFFTCPKLKEVTILCTDQHIEEDAFSGCASLVKINYAGTIEQWLKNPIKDDLITVCCSDGNIMVDTAGTAYNVS